MLENTIKPEPTVATSLEAILATGAGGDRKIPVLAGNNLGSNTLLMRLPLHEFYEISEVANSRNLIDRHGDPDTVAQRNLDSKHATKLSIYILKGVVATLCMRYVRNGHPIPAALEGVQTKLGRQPYMALQPVTGNIRSCGFGGAGLRFDGDGPTPGVINVYLSTRDIIWVVDGQHRRAAVQMMFEYLKSIITTRRYPQRPYIYPVEDGAKVSEEEYRIWVELYEVARTHCTIMVETHLGLSAEQERQLFHDLNNLTKKIESSMAFQFDLSNPVNLWVKENLIDNDMLKAKVVERDIVDWHDDRGFIPRKDLISICGILFLNKTNVSGARPQLVIPRGTFAAKFWETVNKIPKFGEAGAKMLTTAAQPVMLKALAKLAYDFAFGKYQSDVHLRALLTGIPKLPFTHKDPMWRYYDMSPAERKKNKIDGLAAYLPPASNKLRDIGTWNEQDQIIRFSIRHNDIYPILGDIIRWKLELPPRIHQKVVDTLPGI